MSHCDQILEALRDGQWHTTADIYKATGGFLILHSRISDLRKKGFRVQGRHVPGKTGADGYEYCLVGEPTEWEARDALRVRRPDLTPLATAAEHDPGQLTVWDAV